MFALPVIARILTMGGSAYRLAITALIGAFGAALPEIIRRVLFSLGIGAVVFLGMGALLSQLQTLALGELSGMGQMALQIAGILNIDVAFNIVMSAYSIKLSLRSMGNVAALKQVGLRSAG